MARTIIRKLHVALWPKRLDTPDLTDHYPKLIFVKACNYCKNSRTRHAAKSYRTFKHFIPESFTEDLLSEIYFSSENLEEVNAENLNAVFDQFYSLITETINHQAPLRKLSRKQKRLSMKP